MTITAAALQAVLGTNGTSPKVVRAENSSNSAQQLWYVTGGVSYPGQAKWITTTASDNAATQGAAVLTALTV